jgi:DNA-binding NtrC family response regulator
MDELVREFESTVVSVALGHTHGRRIEAAHRLGIGRNTITRKIQELRLEEGARGAPGPAHRPGAAPADPDAGSD